ncbi:DUF4349 domain-containing protein [Micromonospora sp. RTP1Z1]|uniref:DUF4349 domain-containing protein n=1 Tax=Micromonospora sp. RTP1Z1 TaxID=2994043 RepID=UPI0029C86F8E|nr:DUF4349 domain-containing protein [Micromonospora sp. RTP1Z1]
MGRQTGRRRGRALTALGLAAVLLAGCGAADRSSSTGDSAAEAPAGGAPVGGAAEPGKAGAGTPDLRVDQRSIIYTGTMQVQVDDVERAAREAIAAVTAAGGFVGGDQRRSQSADARAELELRVPAAKFTAVVEELAKLGRQQRREVHTQDVTEETVDLDARIISQRARVESARKLLLDRATSTTELINLENELGRREADLASLEAKKRRLADLTALSTITVTFVGKDASTAEEETQTGFMVGLRGGWKVFVASMTILLTVLGAVLPWLLMFGVPLVVVMVVLRRRRRHRPAPPAPPTWPDGGPQPPAPTGPRPPAATAPPPVPAARSGP